MHQFSIYEFEINEYDFNNNGGKKANWWSGMNEPAHALKCINLTAERHSALTSSDQPSNPWANYRPHYVLSVLFPHHINSALWSDRLRTDVERQKRTEMSPFWKYSQLLLSIHPFSVPA